MAMILWGTLDAASDQTMATVTRRVGSEFRQAVMELIEDVAAGIIASDPTLIQAAEQAVAEALENAAIVTSETLDADSMEFQQDGYVMAAIDGLNRDPHLRGASDVRGEITGTSRRVEIVDGLGYVVQVIDPDAGSDGGQTPLFRTTHLIVLAGQSNSEGVGQPILDAANQPLANLFVAPQSGPQVGSIVQATEPLAHPNQIATGRGHGWRWARNYALEHPDVRVVIVPVARGGSGMYGSDPYSWAPSRENEAGITSLYKMAIDRTNQVSAALSGAPVVAVLWHQGERDSSTSTPGATYQTELDALIAGFRSRMTGATNSVFIVGQLGHEYRTVLAPGTVAEINAVHAATPSRVEGTAFAPAPDAGYMAGDNTHFTALGQELLADSMWATYRSAIYNV